MGGSRYRTFPLVTLHASASRRSEDGRRVENHEVCGHTVDLMGPPPVASLRPLGTGGMAGETVASIGGCSREVVETDIVEVLRP